MAVTAVSGEADGPTVDEDVITAAPEDEEAAVPERGGTVRWFRVAHCVRPDEPRRLGIARGGLAVELRGEHRERAVVVDILPAERQRAAVVRISPERCQAVGPR